MSSPQPTKRQTRIALAVAILAVATTVRLPTVVAGLPYFSYIDEGHLVQRTLHLLAVPTWEPGTYSYPTLPFYLVAGAALAYSPAYAAAHGRPLRADLSPDPPLSYDLLEPVELLVIARLVTLAFSLGLVALSGLLAARLAGPPAGFCAAWLAALLPALVARSGIANVNPQATFFTLAALLAAEAARQGQHLPRYALLAGAMTGLAATSKYHAGLVSLPVAISLLLAQAAWNARARALLTALVAAALTSIAAMPALLLRTAGVIAGLRYISGEYGTHPTGSFWEQAIGRAEWDLPLNYPELGLPLLLISVGGLVVGLRERTWAPAVWCWLLFGFVTVVLLSGYDFRPFRNLLPLVPLVCVLVALLFASSRRRVSRPVFADLAAFALPVVLFAPGLSDYLRLQLAVEDTRTATVRWLAENTRRRDRVLIVEELVFLPSQLAPLRSHVDIRPWRQARKSIAARSHRYVVLGIFARANGDLVPGPGTLERLGADYTVVATMGMAVTPLEGMFHFGNQYKILVLRRRGRPGPRPQPPAVAQAPSPPLARPAGRPSMAH